MANPKLWWNGSSWVTSSANWINSSKQGSYQLGIKYQAKLIAYDDLSIVLETGISAYQTASIYNNVYWDGTVTAKSGSTTIGTNQMKKTVTSYSSISISGSLYARGNAQGTVYSSGALSFSGSVNLSTHTPYVTITYNDNYSGGAGTIGTQKLLKGISAKVTPAATPTRETYTFTGWNTKADGTGTSYNNNSTISTSSNITLYAVWSQNVYDVEVSAEEGSTITFDGVEYSGTAQTVHKTAGTYAVSIAANDGYILKTRFPAADGNVQISDNSTSLSATAQHVGCRLDDGEQWIQALIYYDDGENWVMCQAYFDDGEQWILLN